MFAALTRKICCWKNYLLATLGTKSHAHKQVFVRVSVYRFVNSRAILIDVIYVNRQFSKLPLISGHIKANAIYISIRYEIFNYLSQ